MKIIGITFLGAFIVFFLTGKVKVNGVQNNNLLLKMVGSFVFATIMGIMVGLPVYAILALIK